MNALTVISTDLLTPLGAYLRVRESGEASFLLESVEHGRLGRHSFVGCGSRLLTFEEAEASGEPVVGYLGYDFAAAVEPSVGMAEVLCGDPGEVTELMGLALPGGGGADAKRSRSGPMRRLPSRHEYERSVVQAKEHIRAGDVFQVVLSQRAERPTSASALELYRSLRRVNPSPYLFLLELDGVALVGSSPETLVKADNGRASLNPIAGTTRPGAGDAERLLSSEKDRAEHVMLVDLGRNDLSRVCVPGTVRVERFLEPERFSHVTHLVSEVAGDLAEGVTPFDLLRACFPAGTVSGAPKVRAMQLISELEGYRRGPYAGAVGYSLPGGPFDTCIAIRTIVLQDGRALLQAGAGIVADSDPAAEHEECLRKLAALETAIELAEARQ